MCYVSRWKTSVLNNQALQHGPRWVDGCVRLVVLSGSRVIYFPPHHSRQCCWSRTNAAPLNSQDDTELPINTQHKTVMSSGTTHRCKPVLRTKDGATTTLVQRCWDGLTQHSLVAFSNWWQSILLSENCRTFVEHRTMVQMSLTIATLTRLDTTFDDVISCRSSTQDLLRITLLVNYLVPSMSDLFP